MSRQKFCKAVYWVGWLSALIPGLFLMVAGAFLGALKVCFMVGWEIVNGKYEG